MIAESTSVFRTLFSILFQTTDDEFQYKTLYVLFLSMLFIWRFNLSDELLKTRHNETLLFKAANSDWQGSHASTTQYGAEHCRGFTHEVKYNAR